MQENISMSQATISIRVDQNLKKSFDSLCEAFGLSTTAAFNIFMKTVVRERKIPFEIRAEAEVKSPSKALMAFDALRKNLAMSGTTEMTLDEINAEISATRNEKRR